MALATGRLWNLVLLVLISYENTANPGQALGAFWPKKEPRPQIQPDSHSKIRIQVLNPDGFSQQKKNPGLKFGLIQANPPPSFIFLNSRGKEDKNLKNKFWPGKWLFSSDGQLKSKNNEQNYFLWSILCVIQWKSETRPNSSDCTYPREK